MSTYTISQMAAALGMQQQQVGAWLREGWVEVAGYDGKRWARFDDHDVCLLALVRAMADFRVPIRRAFVLATRIMREAGPWEGVETAGFWQAFHNQTIFVRRDADDKWQMKTLHLADDGSAYPASRGLVIVPSRLFKEALEAAARKPARAQAAS